MKKTLVFLAKLLTFFLVDLVGSIFFHPFHVEMALASSPLEPRSFVWDGVILMVLLYALLLLIEVVRKRLNSMAWSTAALLLAGLAGLALKLGFRTLNG
jgi:hypothetical protein